VEKPTTDAALAQLREHSQQFFVPHKALIADRGPRIRKMAADLLELGRKAAMV